MTENFINLTLDELYAKLPSEIAIAFRSANLILKEVQVLICRYGILNNLPLTSEKTGQLLHFSRQRANKLEVDALAKIAKLNPNFKSILIAQKKKVIKENANKKEPIKILPSIYSLYPNYPKEYVNRAIFHTLENKKYKDIFYRAYGNNLENPSAPLHFSTADQKILYEILFPRIQNLLQNFLIIKNEEVQKNIQNARQITSIYQLFSSKTKDEILSAINNLTKGEQNLIIKRYGPNLINPLLSREWTLNDSVIFFIKIIPKLEHHLNLPEHVYMFPNLNLIYELFPDYTNNQIEFALTYLNDLELIKVLDSNYNLKENLTVKTIIQKYLDFFFPLNIKNNNDVENLMISSDNEVLNNLLNNINCLERNIIVLHLGINSTHTSFSSSQIAEAYAIPSEYINLITKRFLKLYEDELKRLAIDTNRDEFLQKSVQKLA